MAENSSDLKICNGTNGALYFAPDVISTIAGLALNEIDGIANTVHFSGLLTERLAKRTTNNIKNLTKGIRSEVKDGEIFLSITCVVEYGYSVPEVSKSIQENVKKTVETMTNMKVKAVDVHVTGLTSEKENKQLQEEEYKKSMLEAQKNMEQLDGNKSAIEGEKAE